MKPKFEKQLEDLRLQIYLIEETQPSELRSIVNKTIPQLIRAGAFTDIDFSAHVENDNELCIHGGPGIQTMSRLVHFVQQEYAPTYTDFPNVELESTSETSFTIRICATSDKWLTVLRTLKIAPKNINKILDEAEEWIWKSIERRAVVRNALTKSRGNVRKSK